MTDPRPYRIYRTSVVGLSLYDTQPTRKAAESSVRTGQVEYPEATFSIRSAPQRENPSRPDRGGPAS